jgi:translation elongation factor EF-1beta
LPDISQTETVSKILSAKGPKVNMPKKKQANREQASIRVGNISDVSGNVNIAGGNISTRHSTTGLSAAEIKSLFNHLYTTIDVRPDTPDADKEDLRTDVKEIETAVTQAAEKNAKVDEGFLSRRLRNIARMAPDVLDVIVTTLTNPLAGLGVAVKKIAVKAREDTRQP